jgi:hypothetical protein
MNPYINKFDILIRMCYHSGGVSYVLSSGPMNATLVQGDAPVANAGTQDE